MRFIETAKTVDRTFLLLLLISDKIMALLLPLTWRSLLVGDYNVGKTTFVKRHMAARLKDNPVEKVVGGQVYSIVFHARGGETFRFNALDTGHYVRY